MKSKSKILVLVIVLLLVAVGIYGYQKFTGEKTPNTTVAMESQMRMEVQTGTLRQTVSASSNIQPIQVKELTVRSGDYVDQINVAVSDRVKKGDILIELNNQDENLSYLKAKNQYKAIQINGSPSEIEEAKISLEIAEEKLAEKTIIAPFTGVIVELNVEEGDFASNNQMVVKMMDDSSYEVEVDVDESDARYLAVDQQVLVAMEALPGERITGKVVEIGQSADVNSGVVTFPVTILLDQKHPEMKPGYSADLEITVGLAENKVIIPITAILVQNGSQVVMKEVDGKVVPVPVQTGMTDGLRIAIESGIVAGDQIMINTGSFAAQAMEQAGQGAQQGMRIPGMMPGGGIGGRSGGVPGGGMKGGGR